MQDPTYNRIESQPRPSLFAASGFVLLASIGLWISTAAALLLPENSSMAIINLVYYLPFVLLPILLYASRHSGLSDAIRLNPLPVFPTLLLAALALNSIYIASTLAAVWETVLNALGFRNAAAVQLPETRQDLIASIFTLAALPAVCEELLFRGVVLSAWESRGTAFSVGVTAVLFALLHGNLYGLPAYLLVGAIAGFVTWALDSVYAGIVYHTIYNAACLIIPWLLIGQSNGSATEFTASMMLSFALELISFSFMSAMILMVLRLRARSRGILAIPRIRRTLERRDRAMLLAAIMVMILTNVILLLIG